MDPAVVYKELRTMHRKMDIMVKKLDNLDRQVVQNSRQVSTIGVVQKSESRVLRKSANSITTLIRMMAGHCGLTDTSLSAILTDALALQKVVEPKPNWNVELNSLTDYPPMHELKLKLTELIQIIDNHKDIVECNRDIGPIITDMNSSTTHTAVSSQNENSAVLPVSTKGPSEVCAASSQKENSAVLLDSTRRTSVVRAASSQIENSAVLPVLTKETSAVYATSSEDENCGVLPVYYFGPSLLPAASPQKENSAVLPALTKETSMVCAASSQKKNSAVVLDSTQGTSVVGAASSQDENCTVLPVYYHGTNLVSAAYPQKENSAVLPASTQGTSMVTCHTNITHLNNSFPNLKKKKEEEDVGALRRKYKNKYRYLMNVNNKPSSTPVKKNVDNIPIREIRGPYRHPIFNNVKEVKIINCTTKTSVIRPLSYVLPQIVLKPSDIANCAAIAPRIKNVNENDLKKKNPSNNSDNNDIVSNSKIMNQRRNLRRHCKTVKKKNIKPNNRRPSAKH